MKLQPFLAKYSVALNTNSSRQRNGNIASEYGSFYNWSKKIVGHSTTEEVTYFVCSIFRMFYHVERLYSPFYVFLRIYAQKLLPSSTYCVHHVSCFDHCPLVFQGCSHKLYKLSIIFEIKPIAVCLTLSLLRHFTKTVKYLRFENGHLQAPGYKFWTTFTKLLSLTPSPPSSPPTWHAAAGWWMQISPTILRRALLCCGANLWLTERHSAGKTLSAARRVFGQFVVFSIRDSPRRSISCVIRQHPTFCRPSYRYFPVRLSTNVMVQLYWLRTEYLFRFQYQCTLQLLFTCYSQIQDSNNFTCGGCEK